MAWQGDDLNERWVAELLGKGRQEYCKGRDGRLLLHCVGVRNAFPKATKGNVYWFEASN